MKKLSFTFIIALALNACSNPSSSSQAIKSAIQAKETQASSEFDSTETELATNTSGTLATDIRRITRNISSQEDAGAELVLGTGAETESADLAVVTQTTDLQQSSVIQKLMLSNTNKFVGSQKEPRLFTGK